MGTPAFMSPEQAAGLGGVDARSDIYSLGAVGYFLLTGRPPFVQNSAVETMAAHLNVAIVPPHELVGTIPVEVDVIIVRCLEKNHDDRFADIAALEADLALCGRPP